MDTTVGRFASRVEAEMASHLLESAGIPARVRADDVAALHPELAQMGMSGGITLVIASEYLDDARELLASMAPPSTAPSSNDAEQPLRRRPRSRVAILITLLVVVVPLALFFTVLDVLTG